MAKVPIMGLEGSHSEDVRTALAEDSSSVPRIHIRQLTGTYNATPVPGGSDASDLHLHAHNHTCMFLKLLFKK